jgi:hypothetical protein
VTSEVWILDIDHRHGNNTGVYRTERSARAALYTYVSAYWGEVAGSAYTAADGSAGQVPAAVPADHDTAIDTYFDAHPSENWEIRRASAAPL